MTDLCEDWSTHGRATIAKVRNKYPAVYLRTIAGLIPRDLPPSPIQDEFDNLTDVELVTLLDEEMGELKALLEARIDADGRKGH